MNDKVTLQDLASELAKRHQLEGADAESFIKMFFTLIEDGLAADKYVKIKGLGAFKLTEVDSRESIDVNTGKRIEIQSYTKVSFTPDAAMKSLINRPFSHFEPVILNEGTTMEAMEAGLQPEDTDADDSDESEAAGEDIEMPEVTEDTGQANAAEQEQSEQPETAEMETAGEESVVAVVLPTEESVEPVELAGAEPETKAAEPLVPVESEETEEKSAEPMETVESSEQMASESAEQAESQEPVEAGPEVVKPMDTPEAAEKETNTVTAGELGNAEPVVEKPMETAVPDHTEVIQEQKRPFCYPWCMIAAILLIGVLVGGVACWILMSGRRYIPENIYRKIIAQEEMLEQQLTDKKPAASFQKTVADTILVAAQEADTVKNLVQKQNMTIQQTPRIENEKKQQPGTAVTMQPAAPEKKSVAEKNRQGGAATTKVETLADTVEYTIIGTKASHTIQPGESMVKLAARFYGNKKLWPYIARYNREHIKNANNVPVGTVVKIPELKPRNN